MVSGLVFCAFSSSLDLTFAFNSSNVSNTSLGNGIPSSFGHSCSRCLMFSSICSKVTVMGLNQCSGVVVVQTDSGSTEGLYNFVGGVLGLVVGVCVSCLFMVMDCKCLVGCDIMVMSFTFPVCSLSSSLTNSSFSSPFFPSFSFSKSSLSFLSLFSSSSSIIPSKFTSSYIVAV